MQSESLEARLHRRENSFDFMRFVAASSVIFSHAFPLTQGRAAIEPLHTLTQGQSNLGRLSVAVFLILSGLLVTRSYVQSSSLVAFARARALRIFPALLAMLVLSAFVLGPALTTLPIGEYLRQPEVFRYVSANLTLFRSQGGLPGVFESNVFEHTVNGSLWTLRFEVAFYAVVAVLGLTRLLRAPVIAGSMCVALLFGHAVPRLEIWSEFYLYFASGALLYLLRRHVRLDWRLALACASALLLTALVGKGFTVASALAGAYLAVWLGLKRGPLEHFARRADLSYGVYIYAFPVQQVLAALLPHQPWWMNAPLALLLVLPLAWASWTFIERPALRLKSRQSGTRAAPGTPGPIAA